MEEHYIHKYRMRMNHSVCVFTSNTTSLKTTNKKFMHLKLVCLSVNITFYTIYYKSTNNTFACPYFFQFYICSTLFICTENFVLLFFIDNKFKNKFRYYKNRLKYSLFIRSNKYYVQIIKNIVNISIRI